MNGPDALATATVASLDAARSAWLRVAGRPFARLIRDRDDRIVASFALAALVATGLTLAAPALTLFVSPLVFGVPHLLADLRYLVVRRGLASRGPVALAVLAPCLLAFATSPTLAAAIALFGAAAVAEGPLPRRAVVAASAVAIGIASRALAPFADAAFAHGHHLIALSAFGALAPRRRATLPLLLLIACVATAALVATFDAERFAAPGIPGVLGAAEALAPLATVLAPGATARTAALVIAVYALHQSLHYAVWLRLVPDAVAERSAPRTFAATDRALRRELGTAAPIVAGLLVIGFVAFAALDSAVASRDAYMRLALFHGPLELALLGLAFAEGRRP